MSETSKNLKSVKKKKWEFVQNPQNSTKCQKGSKILMRSKNIFFKLKKIHTCPLNFCIGASTTTHWQIQLLLQHFSLCTSAFHATQLSWTHPLRFKPLHLFLSLDNWNWVCCGGFFCIILIVYLCVLVALSTARPHWINGDVVSMEHRGSTLG